MTRQWLIDYRNKAVLNQKDVAKKSGISQPSYWAIENGESLPKVSTAKRIAEVLGFDWTEFFEEGNEDKRI